MATYWYAVTGAPVSERRILHAPSLPAALKTLQARGESVARLGLEEPPRYLRARPAAELDLLTTYRQLAAALRGGASLVDALVLVGRDSPNPRLVRALSRAVEAVQEGAPLWEGLDASPRVFRPEVVAVVKAAELSGRLPEALEALAEQGDATFGLVQRATVALVYPTFVAGVAASVLSFFCTFILPKFVSLFRELGMTDDKFPLVTLITMRIGQTLSWLTPWVSLVVIALVVWYFIYRRTASGRMEMDYWWMRVPVLGQLAFSAAVAQVLFLLGLLIRQRVPAPLALRLAGDASGSEALGAALRRAEATVAQGGTVAAGLREAQALPPALLWRLSSAERNGTLPEACEALARLYVSTTEALTRRTLALVEPIAVIILGCVVVCAGLGMFLPLVSIISELSQ